MKIAEFRNQQEVNEGLGDYVKLVAKKFKGLFDAREQGEAEILQYTLIGMKNFERWMGRRKQSLKNVTWETLFTFLISGQGLNFSRSAAQKMIESPAIKKRIVSMWQSNRGSKSALATWGKPNAAIGGPGNNSRTGELAKIAITHFIELAALKYLESDTLSGEDNDTQLGQDFKNYDFYLGPDGTITRKRKKFGDEDEPTATATRADDEWGTKLRRDDASAPTNKDTEDMPSKDKDEPAAPIREKPRAASAVPKNPEDRKNLADRIRAANQAARGAPGP